MSDAAGFTYLIKSRELYSPKTPMAALKAIEEGLLPDYAFVYKANSVHPLIEEPIDIEAIERILSRKDNDLSTNQLLIVILERLLESSDGEIALFAAESINAIENRYNERIETLKKEHVSDDDPLHLKNIAVQFYELALINESRRSIRNFYLFEAYSYMNRYGREARFNREDLIFTLRILITLRALKLARNVIVQALNRFPDDVRLILLAAEIEYYRKNFSQVHALIYRLKDSWESLPEEERQSYSLWLKER
ncbi:MAG: hypothetical protein JW852_00810 [Spirochaetales bacterium]|nr:hypothetical protein [Spirochaetales bacterium]